MRMSFDLCGDVGPLQDGAHPVRVSDGVRLIGIEAVRAGGRWPALRHVFDLDAEAGLHVELNPLGALEIYAVGYDLDGDERLTPV